MPSSLKIFLFLFISFHCEAQDTLNQWRIKYYTEKAERYLDREKALGNFYTINKDGIKMFANSTDKAAHKPEFEINWKDIPEFNQLNAYPDDSMFKTYNRGKFTGNKNAAIAPPKHNMNGEKKLSGFKIAIDAGHTAGDAEMGEIEKKNIRFKKDSLIGLSDSISFAEGMLTFATAQLLKKQLEAEGAEVFLTRSFNGATAFGVTFDSWLKTSYKKAVDSLCKEGEITAEKKKWYLSPKCTKRDKFRLIFKDIELQKRGEIINNYHPDLTVIIHYNVDETNLGWSKPSNKNLNMTFAGGAFMAHDLKSNDKRFEFLRLLITDDLEKSFSFSSEVVKSFEKTLTVKTAGINDAKYLRESCIAAPQKGVFCRNLQLTRFVHGTLVYGETLYQDNFAECKALNKETDKTKNERVKQVADAYFHGILNYVQTKENTK